jgi:hypothetical protein
MRYLPLSIALASVALLSGCGPTLSLHPVYTDKDLVSDLPLEGQWKETDDQEVWTISKFGNGFEASAPSSSDPEKVLLHEVRLGDIRFLDITSKDTPSLALPAHMIARVWMEKEELRIQVLDSEWLRQKIRDTGVPHLEVEDEQVILTAPTQDLQKFVLLYAAEPKAYESDIGKFRRVRPGPER